MMYDIWESDRSKATVLECGIKVLVKEPTKRHDDKILSHLLIWQPKAKKPCFSFLVAPEKAQEYIDEAVEKVIARKKEMEEKKENRKATPEKLEKVKEGSIFVSSWGYEQTNVDFYQVVEKKGCYVILRPIASKSIKTSTHDSDYVTALRNKFTSEETIRKKVTFYGDTPKVTISSYANAYLWDGKSKYRSWGH